VSNNKNVFRNRPLTQDGTTETRLRNSNADIRITY